MATKAAERRLNAWLESDEGRWVTERRAAEPWRYDPNPPEDDICRDCYEWRLLQPGQEHFGYAWWTVCKAWEWEWERHCRHRHNHHDDDVLFANA